MKTNPYKVVSLGANLYGVQYVDYPYIGLPDSWGTQKHAFVLEGIEREVVLG